jgi:hypothetical protein
MQYALIQNNVVANIAEADAEWAQAVAADWQYVVDLTGITPKPGIGWSFNGTSFTAPVVPPEPAPPVETDWKITRFAFRARFTSAEKVAVELGCLDNPSGTQEQRAQSAMLRSMQKDVEAATYIDLKNQDTCNGVQAMETAGLLLAGRATQILDTPPTRNEVWSF